MSNGVLTSKIACSLKKEFKKQGFDFDVYHDHRKKESDSKEKLGKLRSWFGPGLEPKRKTLLADLDIAIVSRDDNRLYALIEIEETTDKPKVILGDVIAMLLGSRIAFKDNTDFPQIDKWTTLIVMVLDKNESHCERLKFLNEQIEDLKEKLTTPNKKIGRISLVSFKDETEWKDRLMPKIYEAVNAARSLR